MIEPCRCGWDGQGDHLCHRCREASGTRRFYVPRWRFSLAGVQMKVSAVGTIACDACWHEFSKLLEERRRAAEALRKRLKK